MHEQFEGHTLLIVDKKQLTECLNTPSLRPRRAGYDYTLIPMDFGGAFHPKIVLLLERILNKRSLYSCGKRACMGADF